MYKNLPFTAVFCYTDPLKEICIRHVIPPYFYSIFIGLLLSEAWANIHRKKTKKHVLNYVNLVLIKNIFITYLEKFICIVKKTRTPLNNNPKGKPVDIILMSTKWLFCFIEIYSIFYIKNVERVPCNIYDLLTPLVLAHWIMGSGIILKGRGIKLCTNFNNIFDNVKHECINDQI